MPRILLTVLWAALPAGFAMPAAALDTGRDDVAAFIREMTDRHGFASPELARVIAGAESQPSIIAAMTRPAEKTLAWHEYRARFITERRVARGVETARAETEALGHAAGLGVPAEVLLAIVGVETFYGENTGKHRVIDALATLAFDYPSRASYFRGELEQFLLMSREETLDPLAPLGSYAGAMGIPQFMPTSFRSYAVDGDGDGHRNLWGSWGDVFSSVANYLKRHGWRAGEPAMLPADASGADLAGLEFGKLGLSDTIGSLRARGVRVDTALPPDTPAVLVQLAGVDGPEYRVGLTNFHVITRYNRSQLYASAVADLAGAIAAARPPAAPASPGTSSSADAVPAPAATPPNTVQAQMPPSAVTLADPRPAPPPFSSSTPPSFASSAE
jgi:membrane-bound lytic murein transglycosylase B